MYISNVIGFWHLDISVPTAKYSTVLQNYFGLQAKMRHLHTGKMRYRLIMLSLVT